MRRATSYDTLSSFDSSRCNDDMAGGSSGTSISELAASANKPSAESSKTPVDDVVPPSHKSRCDPHNGTRLSLEELCLDLRQRLGRQRDDGGSPSKLLAPYRKMMSAAASATDGDEIKNHTITDDEQKEAVDDKQIYQRSTAMLDMFETSTTQEGFHSIYEVVNPLIARGTTCRVMAVKRRTRGDLACNGKIDDDCRDNPDPGRENSSGCSTVAYDDGINDQRLRRNHPSTTYACKVVKVSTDKAQSNGSNSDRSPQPDGAATREMLSMELQVFKSLGSHPSILALHDVIWSSCENECYLVTELAKGGTLADALKKLERFEEPVARAVISQVLGAVSFMHSHGLAHRDLKLDNIFLMESNDFGPGNIKVADFGLTKFLNSGEWETAGHTICGTPLYVAPEMLRAHEENGRQLAKYDLKIDTWACGIILFQLLSGRPPFRRVKGLHSLFQAIRGGEYRMDMATHEWKDVSTDAKDFVTFLLETNPDQRPTADEALKHAWLTSRPHAFRATYT